MPSFNSFFMQKRVLDLKPFSFYKILFSKPCLAYTSCSIETFKPYYMDTTNAFSLLLSTNSFAEFKVEFLRRIHFLIA